MYFHGFVGYAVGFGESGSTTLKCLPYYMEIGDYDTIVKAGSPSLTAAKFNLRDGSQAFKTNVDKKAVRCAFCHAHRTEAVRNVFKLCLIDALCLLKLAIMIVVRTQCSPHVCVSVGVVFSHHYDLLIVDLANHL